MKRVVVTDIEHIVRRLHSCWTVFPQEPG